jgi:hypothetical protein
MASRVSRAQGVPIRLASTVRLPPRTRPFHAAARAAKGPPGERWCVAGGEQAAEHVAALGVDGGGRRIGAEIEVGEAVEDGAVHALLAAVGEGREEGGGVGEADHRAIVELGPGQSTEELRGAVAAAGKPHGVDVRRGEGPGEIGRRVAARCPRNSGGERRRARRGSGLVIPRLPGPARRWRAALRRRLRSGRRRRSARSLGA